MTTRIINGVGGEEASRECPNCHSKKNWKDGVRETTYGGVQRFICRDCGFRFSEKSYKEIQTNENRQLCAQLEAKKLDTAPEIKTVAGEIGKTQQEIEVKIVQYDLALRNKGRSEETRRTYIGALFTLMSKGANLFDPVSVEETIAKQTEWSIRAKKNYVDWYARFAKFLHLEWEKPVYKAPDKVPFFPLESEIDQLISGSPRKTSIALQIAKETGARIGEIVRLKWTDIDFQTNKLAINEPEKGSNCGIYPVTSKLISRIMTLPRKSDRIFGAGIAVKDSITNMLITARKRLAFSLCNPRLIKIHFHTLRHWAITVYAHKVKDPFLVQIFARHKDMKCTAKYIHYEKVLFQVGESDEWTVRTAKTIEDATTLLQVGFEYVITMQDVAVFRKRK